MYLQVMEIEFDFTTDYGEYELQYSKQQEVVDSVLGEVFEVEDGDDLVDFITEQTGWCVKSIDYRPVKV